MADSSGAIVLLVVALAFGALGIGLGMLLAPRLARWTERDDEGDDE